MKLSPANLSTVSPRGFPPRGAGCRASRAFTMMEIAICLAIIGVALVGIIGVLPVGMNTQRANREETVIGQDANVLIELIRNGSRGADDLTNYVFAITNSWGLYDAAGNFQKSGVNSYTYQGAYEYGASVPLRGLYCGTNIIGLLSIPEFTDAEVDNPNIYARAIPNVYYGGYSNHVVAYVRSISGLAAEKPPQDNQILIGDTFSYKLYIVNAPVSVDTNLYSPWWVNQSYKSGNNVLYNWYYWVATATTAGTDIPGTSPLWLRASYYPLEVGLRQHDLRMTFLWPLLPNGNTGAGRHSFRATIAGDLQQDQNNRLFFYQPNTFSTTP